MAISEEARHDLYTRLRALLGDSEAATLMAHLPPVGWADVATKHDLRLELDALEHRFETLLYRELAPVHRELGELRGELGELRGELKGELGDRISALRADLLRTYVAGNAAIMTTLVALTWAAARLT